MNDKFYKNYHGERIKRAFTLAEVLITIGIIGIVAAMTLPGIIANYRKQEVLTRLKKTYATVSNAFQRAVYEYGDVEYWNVDDMHSVVRDYLMPNFTSAKAFLNVNCHYSGCFCQAVPVNSNNYKGGSYSWSGSGAQGLTSPLPIGAPSVLFPDGSCLIFSKFRGNQNDAKLEIFIDVNGVDGRPNVYSRDVFSLWIDKKGRTMFLPYTNCASSDEGCFKQIVMDGWEIKYY